MASPIPASMSRSDTSPDHLRSRAEVMVCTSPSSNFSSTSSAITASPLSNNIDTPINGSNSWASASTLASTSRTITLEQLRLAEMEREGAGLGLSTNEAKLRVLQLKRDIFAARAESPRPLTAGLFKEACSTDLLFLIDTTASMMRHIEAAKDQVKSIVDDIEKSFLNEADVRIAVVGYKDHNDKNSIQFQDFTTANGVRLFLNELSATGGGDIPEDVLGGLQQALNASWRQQTRCIIHIADAPPHGHALQIRPDKKDRYPIVGTEPHGLKHEPLLKQMIELKINYALLRITDLTDRMALAFCEAYAAASGDCKLHPKNRYYYARGRANSKSSSKLGLAFYEAELGTTFNALRHLVVKMVTTSASRTAVRVSGTARNAGTNKKLSTNLAAIGEDEHSTDNAPIENVRPKWDSPGWLNETLVVEGFSPDVVVHSASTLNDMMQHDDNIMMGIMQLTIHKRSQPFAQGALRVASYARTAASTNYFVVKSFKRDGKRLAHLAEDMRCQALCKAFALDFNSFLGETDLIDFIVTTCLKGKSDMASGYECMSLEPFIRGTYVKYSNNCGYVNEDIPDDRYNQAAQAFSHFTFERSQGRFLVSDLQGVRNSLTDPAIHTLDPDRFNLADTNLGKEGFKFFFSTHVCNSICRQLELKSNASMIKSGNYEFRENWPTVKNTICCSNKLCGKIVSLAGAKKSENFPGRWCYSCWLQLRPSMVKLVCLGPGSHHEFKESSFYWESQGRTVPLKCPKHCEEDLSVGRPAVSSTTIQCGNLWARLKSATKRLSCHS